MGENSKPQLKDNLTGKVLLSLQDLLNIGQNAIACDYLSLSVTLDGEHARINITTTDAKPITYTAIICDLNALDIDSLLFVAQMEGGCKSPDPHPS